MWFSYQPNSPTLPRVPKGLCPVSLLTDSWTDAQTLIAPVGELYGKCLSGKKLKYWSPPRQSARLSEATGEAGWAGIKGGLSGMDMRTFSPLGAVLSLVFPVAFVGASSLCPVTKRSLYTEAFRTSSSPENLGAV